MSNNIITNAATSLFLLGTLSVSAAGFSPWAGNTSAAQSPLRFHPRVLENTFSPKAVDKDGNMVPDDVHIVSYHKTNNTAGVVTGPNGEDWFYTLELDGEKLIENEYVTEYDYHTFHVRIYDEKLNFVGQAQGEVTRPEGTLKCQGIELSTQVTKSFFNSNASDYEIMVTANFNPAPVEGVARYGVKQTTEAYSLTAEIPEGGSKCLFAQPGYAISMINTGNSISENFLIALSEETSWDGEDKEHVNYTVYKKAGWGTPAEKVTSFNIDLKLAYSDGVNETIPFVMTTKGNDVYIATALYEKTFLDDPTASDPTLAKDNNYVITLYKASGNEYTQVAETKIPCVGAESSDYQFRSYALGNFSGSSDITFDFGDSDNPCYIITVVDSGLTDDTSAYYAVYDIEGNEITRFGNGSDSYTEFWNLPGHSKQYGFNMYTEDGDYATVLVDYPSLDVVGMVPMLFEYENEIWSVITSPDRTIADGKVYYVASVRASGADTENIADYVAWFTPDGELHHIDTLDFGPNVARVIVNLNGSVLNPYLFNTNKDHEYLAWVYTYRQGSTGTDLALAVCDSKGNIMASRKIDGTHSGDFCYVANTTTDPTIMITYNVKLPGTGNKWEVHNEFIKLPLNNFEGEGTAQSPYLIKTFGDLDQIRNNLTSHFRLANSIDCEGQAFRPIEGEFLGSLDGQGFEIKNLTITSDKSGLAFFTALGHNAAYGETPETAVIKDVTFSNVSLQYTGNALGVKELSFVAGKANNAMMSNVSVINPAFDLAGVNVRLGILAGSANNLIAEACGVKNANIIVPNASGLGGLVYSARACEFTACSFSGVLEGRSNVGGLAAGFEVTPSTVTDCHIDASIKGQANVGGVAGTMNRSTVKRVLVEGTISVDGANAGGIAGRLDSAEAEEDENFRVIDNCVVALSEFNVAEDSECVHRIVGYSSIDDGERYEWVPDPNDSEKGEFKVLPAAPEAKLGNNYVITEIPAVENAELATEGTTVAADEADSFWFREIGYKFGSFTDMPWYTDYMSLPELYFERDLGASMTFSPDEIKGIEGSTVTAKLLVSNVDLTDGNIVAESSDENVAYLNGNMEFANDEMTELNLEIALVKAGTATITFAHGSIKAVLYVTVEKESGIADVTVENAVTYAGGIVSAEGCSIEIYDIQGRIATAGHDSLPTENLVKGIYIVRATADNGKTSVLKISVK